MQNIVRLMGWAYALLFVGVTALGYVPPFHDQQGYLFGLFKLEWWDDALHLGSGIWAAIAAWKSYEATRTYFRIFGPLYFLDGVCGLAHRHGLSRPRHLPARPDGPAAGDADRREPAAHRHRRHSRSSSATCSRAGVRSARPSTA